MAELLAELVAKITADATELKKALSESEKDIEGTGKVFEKETKSWQEQFKAVGKLALGMGASITAAMTRAIMSFSKTGSELHDLSLKTGVSVEALAGLKYAAEQNGASLGTVEMAIRRTASAMQDAKDGLAETKRAFDRMGLSLEELEGLNPEQQFLKIAGAIAEIEDPMTRAATAQDIFGRSGMDMLPMLSQGADGLRKMMEEGQKFSLWTTLTAGLADALGDSFHTLTASVGGLFTSIGSALAPALKSLVDMIVPLISKVTEWTTAHPELTKQLGLVAIALGVFLTLAGTLMLFAPMIAAAWAIAMGPVGLITVAIAGLIAIGILLWQNWDTIKTKVVEIWTGIKDFFVNVWQNIVGIFKRHWALILAILFPAVGLPILIAQNWGTITKIVGDIWDGVVGGVRTAWDNLVSFILSGVNWLIDRVNSVIDLINRIPGVNIGNVENVTTQSKLPGLASGGIVTQPTLAMIGEAGPEAVIPLNEAMGGITINFTQPVFFDREDQMNKFVDMIRKGIQRQDRLRFGGAYSG